MATGQRACGMKPVAAGAEEKDGVLHNDDAENYELSTAPLDATSHEQWEPLLPHDPAVRLAHEYASIGHRAHAALGNALASARRLVLHLGRVLILASLIPYACPCPCPYALHSAALR